MSAFESSSLSNYYYYHQKNKKSWDYWVLGEHTRKKIQREKITWGLGFLLAIIAGFCCGIIAAVSLGSVFPVLASYYWLLGAIVLSGVVLEGSVYAHHLSSIFTDMVFHGFFRSIKNTLAIKHLLKDKNIRRQLLTHYVRLTMGRIKETQSKHDNTVTQGELYQLLSQCQTLSESALKTLLLRFIQAGDAGDISKYSPTYKLTQDIRQAYKNILKDPHFVQEMRWKKALCTLSTIFAIVAGLGLGSIMYTDALQTLASMATLASAAPYIATGIALLMGFAYIFFMIYALREVIMNNLIQHFWRSLKDILRPSFVKHWNPNTSLLEKNLGWLLHISKCLLITAPFIVLCAAAVLVSVSMGKLLIDSSTVAFTNVAHFMSHHMGTHIGNIAHWMATGEIIAGRNIIQIVSEISITIFFIPSDIITTTIYGFESVKNMLQSLAKLVKGEYHVWEQLNEQLAYHQQDKGLIIKTGVRVCMWLILTASVIIHLGGEASIAGLGAENMMGGDLKDHPEIGTNSAQALMAGQLITYIDLILEVFTHIPFLIGGENEDHNHGTGVIDGTLNFFRGLRRLITRDHHTYNVPKPTRITHETRKLAHLINTAIEEEESTQTTLMYSQLFHHTPYLHQTANAHSSPFNNYQECEYNTLEKHVVGILMEKTVEEADHIHIHCC